MSFLWPAMLGILLIVPIFGVLYWLLQQERRLNAQHRREGLVAIEQPPNFRRHVPPAIFLGALALLVVALARPQIVLGEPTQHGTLILAFDVSASMGATDNAPSRMEAAKAAAKALVLERPEDISIGLIAFSNDTVSNVAPTDDPTVLLAAIDQLTPERGTSLGEGILNAVIVLGDYLPEPTGPIIPNAAPGVIVLFTDGENKLNPEPLDAALTATAVGVRIYAVGFGSLDGTQLLVEGVNVHTELNDEVLRDIATLTGGAYFDGGSEPDLTDVFENVATQEITKPTQREITNWLVGGALVVMLVGAAFSLLWFGRLP